MTLRGSLIAGLSVLTLSIAGVAAQPSLPRSQAAVAPGLRALVDQLYSPDPKTRAEAACQIGRRHAEAASAIPVLLSMLTDDVAVPALACEMGPWLRETRLSIDAQKWPQTSPAREAAEALGDIGNAAVPGLLQALAASDSKTRKFAALGLGDVNRLDDPAAVIAALAGRLSDAVADVREQSAWALGEIEDEAAVEPLLNALSDSAPRVRARAAWALGEIESPSAVAGLLAALRDADAAVRAKSVWALGEIESPTAVDGLVAVLADADASVRAQAVWALGEIQSPLAVDGLVPLLRDVDAKVRRQTAWALGEIENPGAVTALTGALRDDDWQVRKTAAWALGEIKDVGAIDALRAAAGDANGEVRRAVDQALRELGDRTRRRRQ